LRIRNVSGSEEELLAAQPADLSSAVEVSEYRTTWIVSSTECLRSVGLYDRYRAALRRIDREEQPGVEDAIVALVANNWIPIALARTHYRACDALGMTESELLAAMVTADGGQVRRTWHAQIIAAAQKPAAAPWLLLPQIPRWWPRTASGGALAVYRQGPQQARIEYRGCSLFDIPFYRDSVRGVLSVFVSHFVKDLSISTVPLQKAGNASFVLRWRG
jgi:hypothetical protein